jgi:hypothetical protein
VKNQKKTPFGSRPTLASSSVIPSTMSWLTLTPAHHAKIRRAMRRLGLSRADVIGLLIEKHAAALKRPR